MHSCYCKRRDYLCSVPAAGPHIQRFATSGNLGPTQYVMLAALMTRGMPDTMQAGSSLLLHRILYTSCTNNPTLPVPIAIPNQSLIDPYLGCDVSRLTA
jgi:hypothetical protein